MQNPTPIIAESLTNFTGKLSADTLLQDAGLLSQGFLIAGVIVGAILFFMGRKLVRPACTVSGLVLGAVSGAALLQFIGWDQWILFGLIGGGILCMVMAWMLFRVWMGLSCAIVLALLGPAAFIIIQGTENDMRQAVGDVNTEVFRLNRDEIRDSIGDGVKEWAGRRKEDTSLRSVADEANDTEQVTREEIQSALWEKVQAVFAPMREEITRMWGNLGSTGRNTILIAGGMGAVIGLLLGLIFPYGAAIVQTAIMGSLLLMVSALGLAYANFPDHMNRVNFTPRLFLLVLGLITIHGVIIQWILFVRKVDKK